METVGEWGDLLDGLEHRPDMYLLDGTYAETCAFLYGFATSAEDEFLGNFNRWIRARCNHRGGLEFTTLVVHEALGAGTSPRHLAEPESDAARARLFDLMRQFLGTLAQ